MPLDINELETPDQERQILDMEKKRKYVESADSNNGSSQPVVPISSNAGLNPHDFNPYQTDQQGNIDYGASALRAIPEASVGYLGLKALQGAGEGLKRTISGENRGIKVQERQLKLQEKEGIKPTVTSEAGIDPKLALEMRLKEEKHIAEERRAEEIHKAKLESMGAKTTAPIESVSPALQGSTVELPNTSTSKIETPPTATGESVLNMLPKGDASAPQSSISVAPNAQGAPAPFAVPTQINTSSNTTGAIGVGNMPEGGSPAPLATLPTTPAQQVIEQTTGIEPKPSVPSALPLGETIQNPVASGDKANPLHEPGSDVGKTQLQASAESTENKPPELKKEIKGAVKPVISRRTKEQTKVFEEEMPQNKFYNQIANRLAGTENLKEHPHITQQFDKAWEDVFHNVLGGKMERSQGGSPAKINEIESHINANAEKYPDLVKYMNEAKQYAKGNVNPKEGGFSHIGAMLGMLGAGGLGAYMLHRYGNPFAESMKKANEAMGDVTGTQDLLKANKAEELSPAMRALFTKASNPVYRKEINEQLVTEKNPERINELKRELEKAK